jgi:hypothetical protein
LNAVRAGPDGQIIDWFVTPELPDWNDDAPVDHDDETLRLILAAEPLAAEEKANFLPSLSLPPLSCRRSPSHRHTLSGRGARECPGATADR